MVSLMLMQALTMFFLGLMIFISVEAQVKADSLEPAEVLFKKGRFAEAEKLYLKIGAMDSNNYQAALQLGNIALFNNRVDDARKWAQKALALKPGEKSAQKLLAQACYREDNFECAAPHYRAIGAEAVANKLESFKNIKPYQIEGRTDVSRVKFLHTDPLPLVQVKVNGGETVNFIIDTGGSEIYLDTDFAANVGATQFGATIGTYGGGQQASTAQGRVDSLTLGDFVVKNVPVHILNTKRFSAAARGKQVDGVLGTLMLSHFLATIDYPNGELILRRKTKSNLKQFEQEFEKSGGKAMPFWMAGDHLMVAWGRVNKSGPVLLFVDTGLAGGGFVCPESMIAEAGIKLPTGQEMEGVGGGGKVKLTPFVVDDLMLGDVKETNITAFYGPFPPTLEYSEGFRIGGLISHTFFRPYALTFDFTGMKMFLSKGRPK